MSESRVAVIGDVHGHADELKHHLVLLGMDPETLTLPSDLTVVQVGDLIHRGYQSHETIQLVDQIMTTQPDQWIQLIGNHEAQYVYGELFAWNDPLEAEDAETLRRWRSEGKLQAAAAVTTATGSQALITHSGLTHDVWKLIISRPKTAVDAAARINAGLEHVTPWLWEPGEMIYGAASRMAGPLWASASAELYPSWLLAEPQGVPMPFHQVHGHSSAIDWYQGAPRQVGDTLGSSNLSDDVHGRLIVDRERRHTRIQVAQSMIIGVDPNHGKRPAPTWAPLLFNGTAESPAPETTTLMEWLTED